MTTTKITPQRIEEAKAAVERLIEEGVYCNWTETTHILKYFFEDLITAIKEPPTNERPHTN